MANEARSESVHIIRRRTPTKWESNENKPTLTLFTEAETIFLTFVAVAQHNPHICIQNTHAYARLKCNWMNKNQQRHSKMTIITTKMNAKFQNAKKNSFYLSSLHFAVDGKIVLVNLCSFISGPICHWYRNVSFAVHCSAEIELWAQGIESGMKQLDDFPLLA